MSKNKPTVTIGISAFNEEANIGYLLESLLKQRAEGFVVEKILVVSDGSEDRTVEVARKVRSKKIEVIDDRVNKGLSFRQNQMISLTETDILVLLNADILIEDDRFISKLVESIVNRRVDLTSGRMVGVEPRTFLEKVLVESLILKNFVFEQFRQGRNVYTVHGAARALSRRLYSGLRFPDKEGEDAYSYLFTVSKGFKYEYAPRAVLKIKLPETMSDHQKQSNRYHRSKYLYKSEFGAGRVIKEYWLPIIWPMSMLRGLIFMLRTPFYMVVYLGLNLLTSVRSLWAKPINGPWERSMSTTRLIKT